MIDILEGGGLRLAVTDVGHGAPLLFCHAFPLDSTLFAAQIDLFSADRRVLAIDFPGLGHSPSAPGSVSVGSFAKGIKEVLGKRGVNKTDAVGISLGSQVLLELAQQAPLFIERLVLGSARVAAPPPEVKAEREATARRVEGEGIGWLDEVWGPRLLRPEPERAARRFVDKIIRRASPQGVAAAARALAERPDQSGAARGLLCRTLVLHGAEDQLTPLAEARALTQLIAAARLEVVTGAGHLINIDEPDYFNRALVSFFGD